MTIDILFFMMSVLVQKSLLVLTFKLFSWNIPIPNAEIMLWFDRNLALNKMEIVHHKVLMAQTQTETQTQVKTTLFYLVQKFWIDIYILLKFVIHRQLLSTPNKKLKGCHS